MSAAGDPRIAIAQPLMQWSGDDNARNVVDLLGRAAASGAGLCVFPELALPGFHRRIAEFARPDLVATWLMAVAQACARHGIAASLGAPAFGRGGQRFNSQLFIDEHGCTLGRVDKRGLTDPEATFFERGSTRQVMSLRGLRCSAVICREIDDQDEVCADLAGETLDIVFWPGLMGPEKGTEDVDPPRHVQQARRLAQRLGTHVVQSNWPNALNDPALGAHTGRSAVISPAGDLQFRLPQARPGLAVFVLGARQFDWQDA